MRILHVATGAEWERAERDGVYRGNTLATEGFIHCAKPEQLMHVLTRYFPATAGHVIVEIDPARVDAEIRWEGATEWVPDSLPDGFPHIYGPLNLSAVTRVKRL